MKSSIYNQTIALAGLAEAVYLVQQIATRGHIDEPAVQGIVSSVLKIDADNVEQVYGGLEKLRPAFIHLEKQLAGGRGADREQMKYAAHLVYLERKLGEQAEMLEKIHNGVLRLCNADDTAAVDEHIISAIAGLYQDTVSHIHPRIIINGEHVHLTRRENTDAIRALLMAGIRSAFLWRQCGGNRWKFLLCRTRILNIARSFNSN